MNRGIAFLLLVPAAWAAKPVPPKASVTVPPAFHNQPTGAAERTGNTWWKGFGDPLLDRLLERAVEANLDIRNAAARLAEAEALRKGSRAPLLPDIGSTA